MKKLLTITTLALGLFASSSSAATIYIDFGSSTLQMPSPNNEIYWNNVTNLFASSAGGGTVGNTLSLVTSTNAASGITLTMTNLFQNENSAGTTNPSTSVTAFNVSNLGRDSLFLQTSNSTAGFTFTGLDSSLTYRFTIFASRAGGDVTDVRSADYTLTGLNTETVTLNASNNLSNTVSTPWITPNASDTITFSMIKALTNDSSSGFAYLGGIQIEAIPEPTSALSALFGGVALLTAFGRRITRSLKR